MVAVGAVGGVMLYSLLGAVRAVDGVMLYSALGAVGTVCCV